MPAPIVTDIVGATLFSFSDLGVRVKVKQPVRQYKDGSMKSLLTVIYEKSEDNQQILQGEFNYTSLPIRKAVAKQLDDKVPTLPWHTILEHVCQEITLKQNRGEPLDIIDEYNAEPPQFLVKPFIPMKQPTIIFGDGGMGKSTLALVVYFSAVLPWRDNPLGWAVSAESKKGLYLDWEADRSSIAYQRERLERGLGIPLPPVNYLPCTNIFSESVDYYRRAMDEVKADFIIIDSLAGACGGDLSASEPATRFFNAVRMLKTTVLILAHNPKNVKGEKTVYGAAIFEHRARSVWECKAVMEEGSDILDMGLFHRKVNIGSRLKPFGLRFEYSPVSITVQSINVKAVPEFRKALSIKAQVYQALCDMHMTVDELTDYLTPVKKNTIEVSISRLKKDGAIVELADGKYAQSAQARNRRHK